MASQTNRAGADFGLVLTCAAFVGSYILNSASAAAMNRMLGHDSFFRLVAILSFSASLVWAAILPSRIGRAAARNNGSVSYRHALAFMWATAASHFCIVAYEVAQDGFEQPGFFVLSYVSWLLAYPPCFFLSFLLFTGAAFSRLAPNGEDPSGDD